jgi:hypothetical protein
MIKLDIGKIRMATTNDIHISHSTFKKKKDSLPYCFKLVNFVSFI